MARRLGNQRRKRLPKSFSLIKAQRAATAQRESMRAAQDHALGPGTPADLIRLLVELDESCPGHAVCPLGGACVSYVRHRRWDLEGRPAD